MGVEGVLEIVAILLIVLLIGYVCNKAIADSLTEVNLKLLKLRSSYGVVKAQLTHLRIGAEKILNLDRL